MMIPGTALGHRSSSDLSLEDVTTRYSGNGTVPEHSRVSWMNVHK